MEFFQRVDRTTCGMSVADLGGGGTPGLCAPWEPPCRAEMPRNEDVTLRATEVTLQGKLIQPVALVGSVQDSCSFQWFLQLVVGQAAIDRQRWEAAWTREVQILLVRYEKWPLERACALVAQADPALNLRPGEDARVDLASKTFLWDPQVDDPAPQAASQYCTVTAPAATETTAAPAGLAQARPSPPASTQTHLTTSPRSPQAHTPVRPGTGPIPMGRTAPPPAVPPPAVPPPTVLPPPRRQTPGRPPSTQPGPTGSPLSSSAGTQPPPRAGTRPDQEPPHTGKRKRADGDDQPGSPPRKVRESQCPVMGCSIKHRRIRIHMYRHFPECVRPRTPDGPPRMTSPSAELPYCGSWLSDGSAEAGESVLPARWAVARQGGGGHSSHGWGDLGLQLADVLALPCPDHAPAHLRCGRPDPLATLRFSLLPTFGRGGAPSFGLLRFPPTLYL